MNRRIFGRKAGGFLAGIGALFGMKTASAEKLSNPLVSNAWGNETWLREKVATRRLPPLEVPFSVARGGGALTGANGMRYENFRIFVGGNNDQWSVKFDVVGVDGSVSAEEFTLICAEEHRESASKMLPMTFGRSLGSPGDAQ